jgi:hypothetical protein
MVTTANTGPSQVRNELDTELSDSDIDDMLDLVERDIDREYGANPGFDTTQHRQDFEAVLAALRIAEGNAPDAQDRTAEEVQTGGSSVTYEASVVARLRKTVRRRDPGSAFGYSSGLIRNSSRHSTTTDL